MTTLALVTDVFFDQSGHDRLIDRLRFAREQGAQLAVLPELPLNPWSPATRTPRDEDAEVPEGPRAKRLGQVARQAGVALVGGVIQREGPDQPRFNTALCFDAAGHLVSRYRKVHVPQEEGYWEADHYQAGTNAPAVIELAGARVGIQICSDINRLVGAHLLAAGGAEVIVVPRATPSESYARWRKVFEVAAITTASYIVSVNRPRPEFGVDIGGPSIVVAPDGALLLETTEPISTVSLDLGRVEAARAEYPGYLAYPAEVYANGWRAVR